MAMWASKTKTAIKHENNPQPDKEGRRSERQATRRTAYWLAQMPTNEPSIGSYRGTEYLDEPSCTTSKHNTPDRDDPVNPLRCLLVLGSAHISVRVPCRRTVFLRRPVVYPSSGVHGPLRCKLLIASLICIVVPVAGSFIKEKTVVLPDRSADGAGNRAEPSSRPVGGGAGKPEFTPRHWQNAIYCINV